MTTDWRTRLEDALRECTAQSQLLGIQQTESADRRAAAIAAAAASRSPTTCASRSARSTRPSSARQRPTFEPLAGDLADRLFALELAELPAQDPAVWQGLAALLSGVYFDAGWIAEPGRLIAAEAADAAGHGELDPAAATAIARAAASWTRVQALAVIDAFRARNLEALPTTAKA
ncbi:hypothetical protein [Yinghuangia seranimata]|uniref:hypothetical protein n=1 Tax=Yinghuangia seranimata TaxID=408067 RepID=UPI00248AC810|nr:hypothetical protein [Yinghuangia seranimata]MDI2127605.1 hypothetical protein [Yinghuangia seranimata]